MTSGARGLLLFGATGDLAQRMLLPSLFALHAEGLIAPDLAITGTARSGLDDAGYRAFAGEALEKHVPEERMARDAIPGFLKRLHYVPLDASNPEGYAALGKKVGAARENLAIFLSTAPQLFEPTIAGLASAGLAGDNVRIGLEKPLGTDLASSRAINDAVAAVFPEARTFRIDHYLGKETVQNLLALRFANLMFEPLWNAAGIEHVQITVSETVGLEGRTAYFDGSGSLRDMVQNHMLQLLALVAMEPPAHFDARAVRDEKVKVLRSLRPIDRETALTHTVIGQYAKGAVGGVPVPGYVEELGRPSDTETFVALKAHVDNWRWKGVPFYLRTGKRMPNRQSEIIIQFRPVPHSMFAERGGRVHANKLVIRLQPEEEIRLLVMAKEPGLDREGIRLREVPLDLSLTTAFAGSRRRIAYERLLLDLIEGDPTLFVRRDEVEAQWEWVDAIRDGWTANGMTPKSYPAGTWGPSAAIALTERDGVSWHD
ncbi:MULTISPECIES: glucose-6-phosphate dehydrogenase [Sphingomonas]|uniref:Glucose-6-phosphate 1-dehydrogenase n=1 Tax=Edaphosphingomonas fennica TaxID=114404 RepID=A0A2T4I1N2_9SPHN|nr:MULTISPECIES: glucose-6-phosphate dehydrogenase [Sphingomonas]AGH49609.1 glucose-6-phosphate 1-dehydrogenase [Sphingomonas sp. MM-1]PTD22920.1 glucose-6-phosphate dehydrogenase [Sphingomonas fennica]